MAKLLIAGDWEAGATSDVLRDKFHDAPFGEMDVASADQVDRAVAGAVEGQQQDSLSPYDRYRILMAASRIVRDRQETFVELMRDEAGFTRADGENEVRRCAQTLELSAEEAKMLTGDLVPMLSADGAKDRMGFTQRAPRGVICAITPFNSPLNTLAHKVGPALAGGNSVVVKPSNVTPLSAVELCRILLEAGLPPKLLALVHGRGSVIGRQLLDDQRIAYYAFTGSTSVGREIQSAAGLRGVQLELGSIASTIVCHDADLDKAVPKIVNAGFRKAGQVCTSVQRLHVDARILDDLRGRLLTAIGAFPAGDPSDPETRVGPMISRADAERAEAWIAEAMAAGARIAVGGKREGSVVEPTVLEGVTPEMKVYADEIFAPVMCLIPFDTLDEAVTRANASDFGLAAGLFTSDLGTALRTAPRLRFGGVHVNEASSARIDAMPFGGVKDSGYGREGPAYAVREMTEERPITISY
ncbi:aldehyde dehydrogenase family protein [Roseisalinus antarcticus]|uniref:NADP-dependent glyceraldehyde-3-phosphate dehydrogenase n=1 Tax=Roseisalinus antarcticus TaxID=254357 RepID=A0A1Y5TC50_9RHOB|nr:aldehyde dehydrogenase family protein [Roseisalinus antarcticus]SLN57065.1 NADP-dependent glyceraldehyde-3-phosphate dehydrogenase [Roseisalinus antarcticus]